MLLPELLSVWLLLTLRFYANYNAVMRNLLLILILLVMSINGCFAEETDIERIHLYQDKLNEVTAKIVQANNIRYRVYVDYRDDNSVNYHQSSRKKKIIFHKWMIPYIDDEDELAGVLSYGIAAVVDRHKGILRRYSISFSPLKYDEKSLKRAVEYMVHAGYDPVALIIVTNKIATEPSWYDMHIFQHRGSKKLMYLYSYIYKKYPAYLIDNKYEDNIYYQNFLMDTKKERANLRKMHKELIKLDEQEVKNAS